MTKLNVIIREYLYFIVKHITFYKKIYINIK